MGLTNWIKRKAQGTLDKWRDASLAQVFTGYRGDITPPGDQAAMVAKFNSWMYAAVNLNASAAASVPLRLYVRKASPESRTVQTRAVPRHRKDYLLGYGKHAPSINTLQKMAAIGNDFEEVTTPHPILSLMRDFNPWMDGFNQHRMRFMLQSLTGNYYLHPIIGEMGIPVELWPMMPQWTTIVPGTEDGDPYIKGYLYGQSRANQTPFDTDEVIHFKRPNPGTGVSSLYYGMGDVEACWSALTLHEQKRRHDVATFENNARPDFAVVAKSGVGVDQLDEFQRRLDKRLRGTGKAGRPFAMSGDIEIKPLTFSPKELGDQDRVLEEIAAVTGVPVSMLLANDPNLASAQVGFASWRENTILPMLRADEEVLNQRYLPLFPDARENAVLAYDNPVPEDAVLQRDTHVAYINAGVMTANEVRAELNMPEHPDGDGLGVAAPEPVDPLAGAFTFRNATAATKSQELTPVGKFMAPMDKAPAEDDTREGEPDSPADILTAELSRLLAAQLRDILAIVRSTKSGTPRVKLRRPDVARIGETIASYNDDLVATMRPFVESMLDIGARAGIDAIDVDSDVFSVQNPSVAEFVDNYTIRLAGAVQDTTVQAVDRIVRQGLDNGERPEVIAEQIEATGQFSETRSRAIARTESARAFVRGEELGWQESGVVTGKKWLLAPSPCPTCRALAKAFNSNRGGIPLGEAAFKVGDSFKTADGETIKVTYEDIAGPPGHPNCRCDLEPVI